MSAQEVVVPYVALINVPGYLPTDDDPSVFATAQAAWAYLAGERINEEDAAEYEDSDPEKFEYSDTVEVLSYIASDDHQHGNPNEDYPTARDGTGTVYGGTPGYGGRHDLGLAYSVVLTDQQRR